MEEIPHQTEKEKLRLHCQNRVIYRPGTNIFDAIRLIVLLQLLILALTSSYVLLSDWFGVPSSFWKVHGIVSLLVAVMALKKLCILAIELYQHYAPIETRKKCTLVPSCSEYALLALKKHGLILGLFKSYVRVFKKCKGFVYEMDYP